MDYSKIYWSFIEDRRTKEIGLSPYELHHVLPRSLGGGNEPVNLIRLSLSDHLFAHMLLAKIHGGPMLVAITQMMTQSRYRGKRSRQAFSHFRNQMREGMRGNTRNVGKKASEEAKRKRSDSLKKYWSDPDVREARKSLMSSPEVRESISRGVRAAITPERSEKISEKMRTNWQDPEYRQKKISSMLGKQYALGHKQSEEAKRKKSEASKRMWQRRKQEQGR